jgi:hypothetical protein
MFSFTSSVQWNFCNISEVSVLCVTIPTNVFGTIASLVMQLNEAMSESQGSKIPEKRSKFYRKIKMQNKVRIRQNSVEKLFERLN